jgi:ADP-ribose pyrophosphatase
MGDEPPHATAARELEEEAGLAAGQWRVLVDLISAPGFSDESVRVFLATGLTEVGRPEAHYEEADMTVKRVPLDDAVHMVLAGEIVNSIAVAGILAAHTMGDPAALRPVDAPWVDRSTRFRARKAAR